MYISLFYLASQNTTEKQVNQKVSQEATKSNQAVTNGGECMVMT